MTQNKWIEYEQEKQKVLQDPTLSDEEIEKALKAIVDKLNL